MATRLSAPTEEELAEREQEILRKQQEREFDENRKAIEAQQARGSARTRRAFRIATPPLSRGPHELLPPEPEDGPTPAEQLRDVNDRRPAPTVPANGKQPGKKSKFTVPTGPNGEPLRTASTIIKSLGVLYVEDRKADPKKAFENLRDSIMSNLDLLLPAMPQIKQMFELLQIGEPAAEKESKNGKAESIADGMKNLRNFLQGEDD
jgi:hypothetical protein